MIGDLIRKRREELGLSQEELAKKCGYKDRSSITKIEKNETDVNQTKLKLLANALEVEPTYFIEIDTPTDNTARILAYADAFKKLSPEGQIQALKYIEFLVNQEANQ